MGFMNAQSFPQDLDPLEIISHPLQLVIMFPNDI